MKKLRIVVRVITAALTVLAVIGVILLITDENSAGTTTYEIIAFSVGMAGMIMAVISQIDAARQERLIDRMAHNISEDLRIDEDMLEAVKKRNGAKKA
ncbi:hypothetical protein FWF48_01320 [Candidatus Saccharibacteria bacterium]|nr:hypothetical protein [Candidatus Saccharibacteria bacterium]